MHISDSQLKTFTVESGLVSRKDIVQAEGVVKEKGVPLKDAIVSLGLLSEDDVRRLQAHIMGIPFVSPTNFKIDTTVLPLIPEPIARKNNIVAYKKSSDSLEVAMLD